jgi:hypothetical protein
MTMDPEGAAALIAELNKIPNPCCGIPGPTTDYGARCHCGKPGAYYSGICVPCGKALGMREPDGVFVEVAP